MEATNNGVSEGYNVDDRYDTIVRRTGGKDVINVEVVNNVIEGAGFIVNVANVTFFPMHFVGLAGMPRRIPGYNSAFSYYNYLSSFGHSITISSLIVFFLGLWYSERTR